ncbi:hypothetical protein CC80DRAFT_390131, partial [Byssothecium circinans]
AATSTTSRYSKRKRAAVNYFEDADTDTDVDADDVQMMEEYNEEPPMPKKRKTSKPKPLPKRKVFPFLELPAEIRNHIYSLCFNDPVGVYLCSATKKVRRTVRRVPESNYRAQPSQNNSQNDSDSDDQGNEIAPLVPALLAVNKQIYQEGCAMLYANDFYMADTLTMHSFFVDIGARAAQLLKNVALINWGEGRGVNKAYNHAAFMAMSIAPNLETFVMYDTPGWRQDPKAVATQFYRDAFPWLEAVGTAKGKTDAAIDAIQVSSGTFHHVRRRRWWYYQSRQRQFDGYEQIDAFREELGKLL